MADRYYRLVSFLVNVCPQPLRELFLKYMNADPTRPPTCTTLGGYLALRKPQLHVLRNRKVIRQDQWKLLFPTVGQVDDSTWDTTLVILLIDELFKMQLQKVEEDAIQDIRGIRNRLQHMAETSIADMDFDDMWSILENATINLAKQIQPSPSYGDTICAYINDTKINNMPKLGDTLRYWYEHIIMQLKSEIEDMKEVMMEISENTAESVKCTSECRTILKESSVRKVGPAGDKVKRMKTVDQILAKLNNYFITTLKDELPSVFNSPPEVADIKTKLRDVHHVVVTGYRGSRYLETALAAIHDMDYNHSRCVEMSVSSDWRHIDPEEVDLVLCREPFGDYSFDEQKTKSMADIFNNMLRTANASDGSKHLDIVIVSEIAVLQHVSNVHEHDLLGAVIKVYQPTTETEPADLTNINKEPGGDATTCTQNLLDFTAAFVERYKDETFHSETAANEAKAKLKRNKVIVLTGPRKCGKTTLAVTLASKYQRNQFLILNRPDDLKLVSLNSICLVLVEDFAGKHRYDIARTCDWMREFEMLYSAVCTGKLNVIITCGEAMLEQCQKEFGLHAILQNSVKLTCVERKVKQEANDENGSYDLAACSRNDEDDPQHLEANADEKIQESEKVSRTAHSSDVFNSIKDMCSLNDNALLCLNSSATVSRLNSNLDVEGTYGILEKNAERICRIQDDEFLVVSDKQVSVYKFEQDKLQHLRKENIDHDCDCLGADKVGNISILDDNHIYVYDNDLDLMETKRLPMKSIRPSFVTGTVLLCDSKCIVIVKQDSIQLVMYKSKTPMKRVLYLEQKGLQPITVCSGKEEVFILCLRKGDGQTNILRLGLDLEKLGELKLGEVFYTPYNITSMMFDSQKSRLLVTYCGKLDELTCHRLTDTKDIERVKHQNTTTFTRVKTITSNTIDSQLHISTYNPRFCQHPDGSFLVLAFTVDHGTETDTRSWVLHHLDSDFQYIRQYNIDLSCYWPDEDCDICCTDSGDVVINAGKKISLYRITNETLQVISSTRQYETYSKDYTRLHSFKNRIYMCCINGELFILDTHLNEKKKVELMYPKNCIEIQYEVQCFVQTFFYINDVNDYVICEYPKQKQLKYLQEEGFRPKYICAASEDSVFVLGEQGKKDSRILQVNTDMEILSDILLEDNEWFNYFIERIVFDRVNARLVMYNGDRQFKQIYLE